MAEIRWLAQAKTPVSLRAGLVFGRACRVLLRHFVPFSAAAALGVSPLLLPFLSLLPRTPAVPRQLLLLSGLGMPVAIAGWLMWFLAPVTQAAIIHGTVQVARGRHFRLGESLKGGFLRLLPIFGLTICWTFAFGLGLITLVFPSLIFITAAFVAYPVCIVEKLGPLMSLERSSELTRGQRWKVFGMALVLGLVSLVARTIFEVILVRSVLAHITTTPALIGWFAWQTVFGAYSAVVVALLYDELRVATEGIDPERMAAVFD
jgi:hypothetical protein